MIKDGGEGLIRSTYRGDTAVGSDEGQCTRLQQALDPNGDDDERGVKRRIDCCSSGDFVQAFLSLTDNRARVGDEYLNVVFSQSDDSWASTLDAYLTTPWVHHRTRLP